jgi:uncharacterized protein YecE (DUF72 family)
MDAGLIYVGVGGWDYEPWQETFYPPGLAKARQLQHAAGVLTATEINATHYKLQKPVAAAQPGRRAAPPSRRAAPRKLQMRGVR